MVEIRTYLHSAEEAADFAEFLHTLETRRRGRDAATVVTEIPAFLPPAVPAYELVNVTPVIEPPAAAPAPSVEQATDALKQYIATRGTPAAVELMRELGAQRVSDLDDAGRARLVAEVAA